MDEKSFLSSRGITVTSSKIDIAGQTFAVRNIGSVKVTKYGLPLVRMIFAGLLVMPCLGLMFNSDYGTGGALLVLVIALGLSAQQRARTRRLVLVTGGGEVTAYESTDAAFVDELRTAIGSAISAR